MRSERKKGRAFLARFMVLMMIINLLSGINPGVVRAATDDYFINGNEKQENGVTISKKVTNYNKAEGTYDIELNVKGGTKILQNNIPLDVVLVMDTSGSMQGSALANAKKAANKFVDKLLPKNKNVKIGIVSFAEKGEIKSGLTTDVAALKNAINGLTAGGGTYTQQGLEKAAGILNNAPANHKKVMVVVGDGEPTFANGEHPNFDDGGFYRVKRGTTRVGYEQWYGNPGVWLGKGHSSKWYHINYLVKLINGGFGNGSKEREGWGHVSWPFNLMDDYFEKATLKAADTIKNNTEIITVGIGLENNNLAKSIMNKLATSGHYLESGAVAGELDKILDDLAEKLQKKVSEGVITDPMSEFVDCFTGSIKLSGNKQNVTYGVSDTTITVRNINLGEGEELTLSYKIKLKDEWKDGEFHKANGKTTLIPTKNGQEMEFNVPEIRADKETTSITVNKTWIGPVPSNVQTVTFEVLADGTNIQKPVEVTKTNDSWTGTSEALPKYKNGKAIEYTVTEQKIDGYESDIKGSKDNSGNFIFNVINKNVEKISFTVEKEWENTPDDLRFDVKVQLYADGNKLKDVTVNIPKANKEATFENLPKYSDTGEKINYTVKEVAPNDLEEKEGKITYNALEYQVTYAQGEYPSKITNKCIKPDAVTFNADLTKKWINGISTKDVEFTFTNKDYPDKTYPLILKATDFTGQNEWKDTIKLPKYNPNGSKAVYTVTEKDVPGFASTVSTNQVDFEHPSVNVTNKRNTKDIIVTKVWEKTPKELETDITVDLYKNGLKSNNSQKIVKGKYQTTFENLPETDESGNTITYTFKEAGEEGGNITLAGGEEFAVRYDDNKHTITNTYKNLQTKMIKVTLIKEWVGPERESAIFNFVSIGDNTGIAPKTVTLTKGKWEQKVDLRKYNDDGTPAKYRVTEDAILGFVSSASDGIEVTKDGQKIIFTNTQIKKKLTINKEWVGTPTNAAFTLTYRYNDEDKSEELTIPSGKREVTKELPVHDLDGKFIEYTVTEKKIEGYQAGQEIYTFNFVRLKSDDKEITFKNTEVYTGDGNTYTIIKNWQGKPADSAYFGLFYTKDSSGELALLKGFEDINGSKFEDRILLNTSNSDVDVSKWTRKITLKPLPKYNSDGSERKYIIKELNAPGVNASNEEPQIIENGGKVVLSDRTYEVTYKAPADGNIFEFTNKNVTKGNIEVTKKWVGTPQPGLKVGLFKKAEVTGNEPKPVAINEIPGKAPEEKIKFDNVSLTGASGEEIVYVARELDANNNIIKEEAFELGKRKYKVSYEDKDIVITNTELIDITVKKEWDNNVPTSEQRSVDVQLYNADGTVKETATLTEAGSWKGTFKDLPYIEGGYTVKEININGRPVEELGKLFKIEIGQEGTDLQTTNVIEGIKEATTITIKNSLNIPEPDPNDPNANKKIKVIKYWETGATPAAIKAVAYSKVDREWKPVGTVEMSGMDGATWQDEITFAEDANEYYVLETSVDGQKLTDEEINNLLDKLENEGKVEYQIGEYDVLAQRIPRTIDVLIKNMSKYKTTRIMVTKDWTNTPESYQKPVTVKLYKETTGDINLKEVAVLTITKDMGWTGWFNGIPKLEDSEQTIQYHVAEVRVGGFEKENVTLAEITDGYTIGTNELYKVQIEGDGTEEVTIKNDIERVNIEAEKLWAAGVTKVPVEFTLYSKKGENFTQATGAAVIAAADNMSTTFTGVPLLDETGERIVYYVFETNIGGTAANHNYSNNYTVKVPGGTYTVTIAPNGVAGNTDKITINNAYTPDSTGPVVPYNPPTDTPDTTPTDTPSTTPTDTTVDVPDDTTPQGDANINPDTDNDAEDTDDADDDVLEVDNDDVPQGTAKTKDDAVKEDPIDVDGDPTPRGNANLPKTGGTTADFLSIIGLGLVGLGLVIKRRK